MRSALRPIARFFRPGGIFLAAACAAGWGLAACSSSYCGAPCDPPPAIGRHESIVNQYGSVFGYLDLDTLTLPQLQAEKTSLELLLAQDPMDEVILKALRAKDDSDFAFAYDDYSTGGSRFNAKGKLRRDAAVENPERRLPRLISESQNRELFERYRRVRLRIPLQAQRSALPAAPPLGTLGNPPDTLWYGSYRADRDSLSAGPGAFPAAGECLAWGEKWAESFRNKAFAFEYECRRGQEVMRRKAW